MYGDTQQIRHLARQMSEQGAEVRELADQLVRAADSVVWQGRAAQAMRERMAERAVRLRATADRHDEAAQALREHAAEVDELKARIAEIAARVSSLVEDARSRLASLADRALELGRDLLPDRWDEALARFVPPPPGHMDWLRVPDRLPGVGR